MNWFLSPALRAGLKESYCTFNPIKFAIKLR
jgi:hypothetical protein